jgi:hypothetical protein
MVYTFSKATGQLATVTRGGRPFSLRNGPVLVAGVATPATGALASVAAAQDGNAATVTATYTGNLQGVLWRVLPTGWLAVTYRYALAGSYDYFGVSFDYPEANVMGVRWLGKGPYRVWKNRRKGTLFDVWARDKNDAITGQVWQYPEFKGYFANLYWARLLTTEGSIHVVTDSDDMFLRLFTARDGVAPQSTAMVFPPGNVSFMHGIPPIGTKFDVPAVLGPQSLPNAPSGTFEGTLYFYFGDTPPGP